MHEQAAASSPPRGPPQCGRHVARRALQPSVNGFAGISGCRRGRRMAVGQSVDKDTRAGEGIARQQCGRTTAGRAEACRRIVVAARRSRPHTPGRAPPRCHSDMAGNSHICSHTSMYTYTEQHARTCGYVWLRLGTNQGASSPNVTHKPHAACSMQQTAPHQPTSCRVCATNKLQVARALGSPNPLALRATKGMCYRMHAHTR